MNNEVFEKIFKKLLEANDLQNESENHWTATTWLVFFENLNCRVIFDSSGNSQNDRPDIQIWYDQKDTNSPDIWLESKAPGSFKSKAKEEKAIKEIIKKVKTSIALENNFPEFIFLTDFKETRVWHIGVFKNFLTSGNSKFDIRPDYEFNIEIKSEFKKNLKKFILESKLRCTEREEESRKLNVEKMVSDLLTISLEYKENYLEKTLKKVREEKKIKVLLEDWLQSGGELTVEAIHLGARSEFTGNEEAFSILCFHSLIVRFFFIKWFLDHGYLKESETAALWGSVNDRSSHRTWKNILCANGQSSSEKVIREQLKGNEVYLWVLDVVDTNILVKIQAIFKKYSLLQERSDILGEFYQRYMQKFAKSSQMLLGQFYTPHTLTRAMWKIAGDVMREKGVSLADKNCLVIDPCVGTGTFLTQGMRLLLDGGWGESKRKYKGSELEGIFKRFTGFEVNPLSRGVSIVNAITEVLAHSSDGCDTFSPELRIFETNAYDIPDSSQGKIDIKLSDHFDDPAYLEWRKETILASKAKSKNQYRIVIGNPPWKNPSPACKSQKIMNVLKDDIMPWAWEYEGEKLSSIPGCNHGIRDDYVFFFGLGMRLLQERGMLVYVTNESWLTAPTYTLFRKNLLDNFKIHTVMRLGPYFNGVKERAAVVVFEKTDPEKCGRSQEINFIDWSDVSNTDWSKNWVNQKLDDVILGKIKRSEWKIIKPVGDDCSIRMKINTRFSSNLTSLVNVSNLFKKVSNGAQSGCMPIFTNTNKEILEKRIKLLFSGKLSALSNEIADEVRGGREKADDLIYRIYSIVKNERITFNNKAIKKYLAHFREDGAVVKEGYCYFDSRLWLFPRVDRVSPCEQTLWDTSLKLIYRHRYDPDDKHVISYVERNKLTVDNHFFNGGVFVSFLYDENGRSLLSDEGEKLAKLLGSKKLFLGYVSAILNSKYLKEWSIANPGQIAKIPTSINSNLAKKCAQIELSLPVPWSRTDKQNEKLDNSVDLLLKNLEDNIVENKMRLIRKNTAKVVQKKQKKVGLKKQA